MYGVSRHSGQLILAVRSSFNTMNTTSLSQTLPSQMSETCSSLVAQRASKLQTARYLRDGSTLTVWLKHKLQRVSQGRIYVHSLTEIQLQRVSQGRIYVQSLTETQTAEGVSGTDLRSQFSLSETQTAEDIPGTDLPSQFDWDTNCRGCLRELIYVHSLTETQTAEGVSGTDLRSQFDWNTNCRGCLRDGSTSTVQFDWNTNCRGYPRDGSTFTVWLKHKLQRISQGRIYVHSLTETQTAEGVSGTDLRSQFS